MSIPPIGSVVTLECQGDASGARFLDGRTETGTVGLVDSTGPSGTQWALTMHAHGVVALKCMGDIEGDRYLDGRTVDRTVRLAPNPMRPYSGTRWAIKEVAEGIFTLRCLGHAEGDRFLDGRTQDGTVGLAPTTDGVDPDHPTYTGTIWHLNGDDNSFTLKCLGTAGGSRFLDGRTMNGTVGLAPHTSAPHSGTRWQMINRGSGESALKCLGEIDGLRFLDGRTQNGTVALVADADLALSGTHWRVLMPCPLREGLQPLNVVEPVTVRVAQLTGSEDPEDKPILNNTKNWGVPGLDLGANCEHSDGRLYIFLSDVVTKGNPEGGPKLDSDLVAWIDASTLGGHEAAGHNFVLPYEPTPLEGQDAWRYCRNCRSLFFDGHPDKGVCPAGGVHVPDGAKFVLPYEPTNVPGQRHWRRCTKCQGMFFEQYADRGVCLAGGVHVAGVADSSCRMTTSRDRARRTGGSVSGAVGCSLTATLFTREPALPAAPRFACTQLCTGTSSIPSEWPGRFKSHSTPKLLPARSATTNGSTCSFGSAHAIRRIPRARIS